MIQAIVGSGYGVLAAFAVGIGYYAYLVGGPSGQTLGKRAFGIRVVDLRGGGPIGARGSDRRFRLTRPRSVAQLAR